VRLLPIEDWQETRPIGLRFREDNGRRLHYETSAGEARRAALRRRLGTVASRGRRSAGVDEQDRTRGRDVRRSDHSNRLPPSAIRALSRQQPKDAIMRGTSFPLNFNELTRLTRHSRKRLTDASAQLLSLPQRPGQTTGAPGEGASKQSKPSLCGGFSKTP
jgi:hypothetical protein